MANNIVRDTHTFDGQKYNLDDKDKVAASAATQALKFGTVTQASNHGTAVELNALAGKITTAAATLNTNTEAEFTFTNSAIKANSLILLTMEDNNTQAASHILVTTNTIADGSCKINLFNCGSGTATATACGIHFLILNSDS